jgi:hypothetical protein
MSEKIPLVDLLERAWQEWVKANAGLLDADFEEPIFPQWNLKDLLGHVLSYHDLAMRHVKTYKRPDVHVL